MWHVIRYACLPEDEGCTQHLGLFETLEKAEAFIQDYLADGYFKRGDLGLFKVEVKE